LQRHRPTLPAARRASKRDSEPLALLIRRKSPILDLPGNRLWRYTAHEIGVADPGAVPGASTNPYGGEAGSTRVIKMWLSLGMVPPISGHNLVANDNFAQEALAA